MDELCQLQALLLWALTVPQVSALRDIVETWDERRHGPKGDPGERGPPGKEVSGWWLFGGDALWRPCSNRYKHPPFSSHRAPLVFLENVD